MAAAPSAWKILKNTLPLRRVPYTSDSLFSTCTRAISGFSQLSASSEAAVGPSQDPSFATLNEADVAAFRAIMGDKGVVQDPDSLHVANRDWMGKYFGASTLLLKPTDTWQVSALLRHCSERQLAVVPQGGNTGLVGGSVPVFNEVILNLGAMNRIISFDEVSGILVCEAGCILEHLSDYVSARGFTLPVDLGARGSCQVGGNVATNAGGVRVLRYGSLHGSVLGLEVVLSDGTVLDLLRALRKDNTGYDLKQLFIGAEGTLGVVTKVALLTPPQSSSVHVAFLACSDYEAVQATFVEARKQLGEVLSAFEFLDRNSLDLVLKHREASRDPLPNTEAPFYVLLETSGSNETHDREKVESFLEGALEGGMVVDAALAEGSGQRAKLWELRESVPEALQRSGVVYKYDLSIPVRDLYKLVEVMRQRLDGLASVFGYGHLGDGNLHLNISASAYTEEILSRIEPFVYEWTAEMRGSVSAEHGIGLLKASALHYSKPTEAVDIMSRLKTLLDPSGILNPYKVLPPNKTVLQDRMQC